MGGREAHIFGSFEVDGKMEFARHFDRQITWLCPVEDLLDEICAPAPYSINCRTIGKKSADLHPFSIFMGVRNFVFYSEVDNPLAIKDEHWIGDSSHRINHRILPFAQD